MDLEHYFPFFLGLSWGVKLPNMPSGQNDLLSIVTSDLFYPLLLPFLYRLC